jgi:hypothetical protein
MSVSSPVGQLSELTSSQEKRCHKLPAQRLGEPCDARAAPPSTTAYRGLGSALIGPERLRSRLRYSGSGFFIPAC